MDKNANFYKNEGKNAADTIWLKGILSYKKTDPRNLDFAKALISQYQYLLYERAAAVKEILKGGSDGAAELNVGKFHGINELIQNADDVGANKTSIRIVKKGNTNFLHFSHNGSPVEVQHILPLIVTFLSTKKEDEKSFGKFGIGLKTCSQFAESMEVHCTPYHFLVKDQSLSNIPPQKKVLNFYSADSTNTSFIFQLKKTIKILELENWLKNWGESSLMFLKTVKSFHGVVGRDKNSKFSHSLLSKFPHKGKIKLRGKYLNYEAKLATGRNKKCWHKFSLEFVVPKNLKRATKETSRKTVVAIAVPNHITQGKIFVGLPTDITIEYPSLINAQFDPDSSRERITDSEWNKWLLRRLVDVIDHATKYLLKQKSADFWLAVPLPEENECNLNWLEEELEKIFSSSRKIIALAGIHIGRNKIPFRDLSFAEPELNGILDANDLINIFPDKSPLPKKYQSHKSRWHIALNILDVSTAATFLDVLKLCNNLEYTAHKSKDWFLSVGEMATESFPYLGDSVTSAKILILSNGHRVSSDDGPFTGSSTDHPFLKHYDLFNQLEDAYIDKNNSRGHSILKWLKQNDNFVDEPDAYTALNTFINRHIDTQMEVSDAELLDITQLLAQTDNEERADLGKKLGFILKIRCFEWMDSQKSQCFKPARKTYMTHAINRDHNTFVKAAGLTEKIYWIDPTYEKLLRTLKNKNKKHIGPTLLFDLLGAHRSPRLTTIPIVDVESWEFLPDHQNYIFKNQPHISRKKIEQDTGSPDLFLVLKNIKKCKKSDFIDRSKALFESMARNWEREYKNNIEAFASYQYFIWRPIGTITSSWLHELQNIEWVVDKKKRKRKPRDLMVETPYTSAIYGISPEDYLGVIELDTRFEPFQEALGMVVKADVLKLLNRLEEIRDNWSEKDGKDKKRVTLIYHSLAELCDVEEASTPYYEKEDTLDTHYLKQIFNKSNSTDSGMILIKDEWHSTAEVWTGKPIFGKFGKFVSQNPNLQVLWKNLGITKPSAINCISILKKISTKSYSEPEHRLVLIETFLYLNSLANNLTRHERKELSALPLLCNQTWHTERPIMLLDQPNLLQPVNNNLIWSCPVIPTDILDLIPVLDVEFVKVSELNIKFVSDKDDANPEDEDRLKSALNIFGSSVAKDNYDIYDSLKFTWSEIQGAGLQICDKIIGEYVDKKTNRITKFLIKSIFSQSHRCFISTSTDNIFNKDIGGAALSICFSNPHSAETVKLQWYYSISEAVNNKSDDYPQIIIDQEDQDETTLDGLMKDLSGSRIPKGSKSKKKLRTPPNRQAAPPKQRMLKPLESMGTFGVTNTASKSARSKKKRKSISINNKIKGAPNLSSLGGTKSNTSTNFNNQDLEEYAKVILDGILQSSNRLKLKDISGLRGVGADVLFDKDVFIEIKATGRNPQTSVSLTANEFEVARIKGSKYYLALFSGLEEGYVTQVKIIKNPLSKLDWSPSGSVTISGLKNVDCMSFEEEEDIPPNF